MSEEQNKNREKREFERGNNFDVFVSYRRSDGKSFARTLNLAFKNEGFRCFLDYDKLEGGDFSKQLQDAVVDAPIFVMVMTPDYFARCVKKVETPDGKTVFEPDEEDWVRREIELALSNGKIIIPIDVNGMLNGTPDYLDKDFGNRVGCHQFSPVYDNNAFEATFDAMLNKNIWNRFSKLQKPTDKAMVTVATDADCKLMKNNEVLATLQAGEHSRILLGRGNHLLQARSEEFPQISVNVIKSIPEVPWEDFIDIKLKDNLPKKPIKLVEPTKPEPPQPSVVTPTPTDVPQVPKVESVSPSDFRLLRTLKGHTSCIFSVAVSPDGKYLASGSRDRSVKIWNAKSGQCNQTFCEHSDDVWSICWSPDGNYLASGSDDKTIKIWDAKSGKCIRTLEGHSNIVRSVSWSPDGNYLASGSYKYDFLSKDGELFLWHPNIGELIRTLKGHSHEVHSVCWSPDGKYLASGSYKKGFSYKDGELFLWHPNTEELIRTLKGHSHEVHSVCWSPDGKYLASGSRDKTIKIWDAKNGECMQTLKGHSHEVFSVCWSPDGKYLASGSMDETVKIWHAKSGRCIRTLKGHSHFVNSVCWSPDGKYLASGSRDGIIKIWGVE